jgi:hypothetical protein
VGLVQHASGSATSGSSVTATFGSNTSSGNSIIVCVSIGAPSTATTVSSVALTGSSDTFVKAVSQANATAIIDSEIWYDSGNSAGHTVVTVNLSASISGGGAVEIDVYEWNGLLTASALDKTHTGSGSSVTSWSSGSSGTLSQSAEVAFGTVSAFGSPPSITGPSSPWTNEPQITAATSYAQMSGYQQVSATTALTYNGTFSGSTYYAACIATFKIASGGGVNGKLLMVFP